jgi:hypothetical protein
VLPPLPLIFSLFVVMVPFGVLYFGLASLFGVGEYVARFRAGRRSGRLAGPPATHKARELEPAEQNPLERRGV